MVSEFIENAWNAFKRNFWTILGARIIEFVILGVVALIFFALAMVLFIPGLIAALAGGTLTSGAIIALILQSIPAIIVAVIGLIVVIILAVEFEAGLIGIYADSLKGKAKIETMFDVMKKKFWSVLGANLLVLVILLILVGVLVLPFAALMVVSPLMLAPMVVGLIIVALISLLFILVNQAIVVGNTSAIGAIEQSVGIVKRNYLPALAIYLIFLVINLILMAIGITPVLSAIMLIIILLVVAPLQMTAFTAFYNAKSKAIKAPAVPKIKAKSPAKKKR